MDDLILYLIYILIIYSFFLNYKLSQESTKRNRVKHYNKPKIIINDIDTINKQEYILKQVKKIKNKTKNNNKLVLIQAYNNNLLDDVYYSENFDTVTKQLASLNEFDRAESYYDNVLKSDLTYNKFQVTDTAINSVIKPVAIAPGPVAAPGSVTVAPGPVAALVTESIINNPDVEVIIGSSNAPMYASIESINNPIDIFLFNQINQSSTKTFSFIETPLNLTNNKINYIKNNTSLEINIQNLDAVVGFDRDTKHDQDLANY